MGLIKKFIALNRKYSQLIEKTFPKFFETPSYKDDLLTRIHTSIENRSIRKVLEVGGIDRPLLCKANGYLYYGMDIESKDMCYEIYDHFIVQSIEEPIDEKFDLIISITLLEHVPDTRSSIKVIYSSLNPHGEIHHYIPSKWHPYSIALRIVGPVLQKHLIPILRPGTEDVSGYPAYFDYCSVQSMKKLLMKQGFDDIDIKAYYRANDYFAFFFPLFILITAFENICKKLKLDFFASGFIVSAKVKTRP